MSHNLTSSSFDISPGDQVLSEKSGTIPRIGFEHLPRPGGLVAGGILGLYALVRRDTLGLFAAGVGAGLLYRGVQANGLLDGGWLRRLLHTGNRQFVPFERQLIIDRPPADVYRFWRSPENIAVYSPRVRDVEKLQESLYRWELKLTDTLRLTWTAELLADEPNQLLVWRSRNPSDLYHEGWVSFEPLRDGASTRLTIRLYVLAPGGAAGANLMERLEELPIRYFSTELQRLRDVLESDDVDALDSPPAPSN